MNYKLDGPYVPKTADQAYEDNLARLNQKNPLKYFFHPDVLEGRPFEETIIFVGQGEERHQVATLQLYPWKGKADYTISKHLYTDAQEKRLRPRRIAAAKADEAKRLAAANAEWKKVVEFEKREKRLKLAATKKKEFNERYAAGAAERREAAKRKLYKHKARTYWNWKPIKTYAEPIPYWRPPAPPEPVLFDWYPKPYRVDADHGLDMLANLAAHFEDPRDAMDFG
ncbi:hypothetical protein [Crucivirus-506]|nr:hypothetical protein [Crucivirus-505]QMW68991.1 hypothetical protein [Crucivirus-506]